MIFKTDSLFLNILKKVITKREFSCEMIFFFLNSHHLCAFVLIWLSSCQPPYGNLPTLTISIFVVLTGTTILREEVNRAGLGSGSHRWLNSCGWSGMVQTASGQAAQNKYLLADLLEHLGKNADDFWLSRDF